MAGTDCGFDTSAGMGRVTEDVVRAKLAAMAEGGEDRERKAGVWLGFLADMTRERSYANSRCTNCFTGM